MTKNNLGVSVIICCYNSMSRLPETLRHLGEQVISDDIKWEIVIVDNASTDNSEIVAKEILEKLRIDNFSFQIVIEKNPGLSFARLTGVLSAKYRYILFCDDDNWLAPNYIQKAFQIINSNPKIGALGGQGYAVSDVEIPEWFNKYEEGYAVGKQGLNTGDITSRLYLCGAGLVTRKELFLQTVNERLPSLLTDRKGKQLSSGGDSEYCHRLILQDYILYYCEELVYGHFIPSFRLTEEYREKLYIGFTESQITLRKYWEAIELQKFSRKKKLRLIIAASLDFMKALVKRRKVKDTSCKIFHYYLNVSKGLDREYELIRHFYNVGVTNKRKSINGRDFVHQ